MTTTTKTWNLDLAVERLGINHMAFDAFPHPNGDRDYRGISNGAREFTVNPDCPEPVFVAIHELAHIVLKHAGRFLTTSERALESMGIVVSEIDAHSVALAVANTVLTEGVDYNLAQEEQYLLRFGAYSNEAVSSVIRQREHVLRTAAMIIYQAGLE